MPRIKLLLLIPHLGGGGAERVTALLAQRLDPNLFDILLVPLTADKPGAKTIFPDIRVQPLQLLRVRDAIFPLITLIRSESPNILLSNMAHLNHLVLMIKLLIPKNTRIIVRQNATASASTNGWLSRSFYTWLYPGADLVLCQSEAMADDLAFNFSIPRDKLAILANPIDVSGIQSRMLSLRENEPWDSPNACVHLLTVGRLSYEKGLDLLLQSLPAVRLHYPNLHVTIAGTGMEAAALATLTHQLALEANVRFVGHCSDLTPLYSRSHLFVQPSRHEGMPNALLEAAAAGLPIVATPCCQGVTDLLRNAPGTWISSEISSRSLSDTIVQALDQLGPERPSIVNHKFITAFESQTAIRAYQELLIRVASHPPQ